MLTRRTYTIGRQHIVRPILWQRCASGKARVDPARHTTYFQQPPVQQTVQPSNRGWRYLRGTSLFLLGTIFGSLWVVNNLRRSGVNVEVKDGLVSFKHGLDGNGMTEKMLIQLQLDYSKATQPAFLDAGTASIVMGNEAVTGWSKDSIRHEISISSNFPNEDSSSVDSLGDESGPNSEIFGIYDGHAGPRLSRVLAQVLPTQIALSLSKMLQTADARGEQHTNADVATALEEAFLWVDDKILQPSYTVPHKPVLDGNTFLGASLADEGSCALVAYHEPKRSMVHVANTGDSRAVLGRWDPNQQRYVAIAMSTDHTGFNEDERNRLTREHPGEDVVDGNTGRLFGLAVTRAFGDSRWKLPEQMTRVLHERVWAKAPRPNGVVKSPPYLTAQPEVRSFEVQSSGARPDFMIMASDGLWDQLSSEQAVELVQLWLDKYRPADVARQHLKGTKYSPPAVENTPADTYYDPQDGCTKWHNGRQYWTTKDDHCGMHLVRNALGGSRDALLSALISLPPSRSRDARDDITVKVVFFGADTKGLPKPVAVRRVN